MASAFRADHVGSLLRPPELLQARTDFAEGRTSADQLRAAEDAAVLKALELQRQAGIDVYTEGEYRRAGWSTALRDSVEGLVPDPAPQSTRRILGRWQGPSSDLANTALNLFGPSMVVGARLRQVRRLAGAEAAFLRQHAPGPWKITMPGPMTSLLMYKAGISDKAYPTRKEFVAEIAAMIQREVGALIEDGASYIQLDSLHCGARREGGTVGVHMCRGNNRSAWHAEGSYEPIAEKAFGRLNVDRFLLEYDTDRAGGFEPLRFVPRNKMVVLGLISSKLPQLESIDQLRRRIDEAAKYVPIETLATSPQCGFAWTVLGNLLPWDDQRRKLELVVETARKVWG